jgi:hypothetical protein
LTATKDSSSSRRHESNSQNYSNYWRLASSALYSIFFEANRNRNEHNTINANTWSHRSNCGNHRLRDSISYIRLSFFRKAKLVLEPKVYADIITEDNENRYKVTFWIYVFNHGKETAQQCRPFIKLTDISGTKRMVLRLTRPYSDYFPIEWQSSFSNDAESQSSLDIAPSKDATYATIKIPFELQLPISGDVDESAREQFVMTYGFRPPISLGNPVVVQYERGYHIELRIDTRIICQSRQFSKSFVIRLIDAKPKLPTAEDVKFTILDEDENSDEK